MEIPGFSFRPHIMDFYENSEIRSYEAKDCEELLSSKSLPAETPAE